MPMQPGKSKAVRGEGCGGKSRETRQKSMFDIRATKPFAACESGGRFSVTQQKIHSGV